MKQKMKAKIIKIEDVRIEKETYPRLNVDWITSARYYNAIRAGAKFPAITVARIKKDFYLVDGAHRLKAFKDNKATHVQVEVLEGLNKKQIYVEAVRRNAMHGRQFSTQEIVKIAITLQDWKLSQQAISELIRIPATEIKSFVAKRLTSIYGTNEEIPLKAPLRNFASVQVSEDFNQERISGTSQSQILDALIFMVENNQIETGNALVMRKLGKLNKLLESYF